MIMYVIYDDNLLDFNITYFIIKVKLNMTNSLILVIKFDDIW